MAPVFTDRSLNYIRLPMPLILRTLRRSVLVVVAAAVFAPSAFSQMAQPDSSQLLSSSDVTEQQLNKTARIWVAIAQSARKDQKKLRQDMENKYGNPQQMDSTQKAKARNEMRRRQMQMQKKQMKLLQQQAKKEGLNPKLVQRIMQSARQDSTLGARLKKAVQAEMKKQGMQMPQPPNQQNQ